MEENIWKIFVTKHCIKRIIERAEIIDRKSILKFLEKIVSNGYIVDRRRGHLLIKYGKHYLVLRKTVRGYLIITYTRKVVPRGFNESSINIKVPKHVLHVL